MPVNKLVYLIEFSVICRLAPFLRLVCHYLLILVVIFKINCCYVLTLFWFTYIINMYAKHHRNKCTFAFIS